MGSANALFYAAVSTLSALAWAWLRAHCACASKQSELRVRRFWSVSLPFCFWEHNVKTSIGSELRVSRFTFSLCVFWVIYTVKTLSKKNLLLNIAYICRKHDQKRSSVFEYYIYNLKTLAKRISVFEYCVKTLSERISVFENYIMQKHYQVARVPVNLVLGI